MDDQRLTCGFCNSNTYEDTVRMCLWEGDRLIVIEGVPARVCERCLEQFYDDLTVYRVDLLRGTKFPPSEAKSIMQVPVFTLPEIEIPPEHQGKDILALHRHPYDDW